MTTNDDTIRRDQTTRPALTTEAADHPAAFAAAFNSGDPDAVERLYEDSGLLAELPGHAVSGGERRHANARLMALGVPIEVRPRHTYVVGDIALLIVDWSIAGDTVNGDWIEFRGTATDVARRGLDGRWRYVIDNPFGVAEEPSSAEGADVGRVPDGVHRPRAADEEK